MRISRVSRQYCASSITVVAVRNSYISVKNGYGPGLILVRHHLIYPKTVTTRDKTRGGVRWLMTVMNYNFNDNWNS